MELSELTAYAEEKYHIREQHKWADFPGFSVLVNPRSGKWAALLMRQWDSDTGTEIQRCDIKCGQRILSEIRVPYLREPFRMTSGKWVGVSFDRRTQAEVVFRLFDRAVFYEEPQGCTIVLDTPPTKPLVGYRDTALPVSGQSAAEVPVPGQPVTGGCTAGPAGQFTLKAPEIPDRIRRMIRLYEYQDGSFFAKCKNFYLQGKFMEDYEDDAPWDGSFRRYFPTYHDLNVRQLRGYFTWRTRVRKGTFSPIALSLAYLYLYELLNGIGTGSPEDALAKMQEFETGFLDAGLGDEAMRGNLRRWMLEYAVLHDVPPALARRYICPERTVRDEALAALLRPEEYSEEEIFAALCVFAGKKLEQSVVLAKDAGKGRHFFAALWRYASRMFSRDGKGLAEACFGKPRALFWRPLGNAVYWERTRHPDADYVLNACRSYHCRGGTWKEMRYDRLYFDQDLFRALLHEGDRMLRREWRTGHYLRKKPDEAWASPYVEAVLKAERQAELEAARPKITIDFSNLEQIRQDAGVTCDSLLTEEELDSVHPQLSREQPDSVHPQLSKEQSDSMYPQSCEAQLESEHPQPDKVPSVSDDADIPLDALHRQLLLTLARNESIEPYQRAHHLMLSVAADTINEALFDIVGDNVLECDGDTITLVEDYRDEVLQILGGRIE